MGRWDKEGMQSVIPPEFKDDAEPPSGGWPAALMFFLWSAFMWLFGFCIAWFLTGHIIIR